ncbi:putative beta-glucosidase 11-like isoform X1 [Capsicum annuum]|nr:putative beta-glucosidase 11-like isoform X1 [Capsicum annuum]KAF3621030.1 putative beta-glucosidase 11-like isoform X1 [Capsicum annuum]
MGFFRNSQEDIVINILFKLEDDPRSWARLCCVSTKFGFLIYTICCKSKCSLTIPVVVTYLLCSPTSSSAAAVASPPGERELGPHENYQNRVLPESETIHSQPVPCGAVADCGWSMFDDLLFDTVYDAFESTLNQPEVVEEEPQNLVVTPIRKKIDLNCSFCSSKQTWDLHSVFCLRRYFGYHDDREPVVRAYVCENGHVSGAWTD